MQSEHFCELIEKDARQLRAYALSLARSKDRADDLVQDALMRAWAAKDRFIEGTNFKAWLFTILRNRFFDQRRGARKQMDDIETIIDDRLTTKASQEISVHFDDVARAFWRLTPPHREMIMLIGANGMSYGEAAQTANCAVGTVRSRLSRARRELRAALEISDRGAGASPAHPKGAFEFLALLQSV